MATFASEWSVTGLLLQQATPTCCQLMPVRGTGIFGGTFDPVHVGHVQTVLDFRDALGLRQVLVIPTGTPPHREVPGASPQQRLAMLGKAFAGQDRIVVDDREIHREGRSYTVDTLCAVRAGLPSDEPLVLALGQDAWLMLTTWRRWRELIGLSHIAVLKRPGSYCEANDELMAWAGPRAGCSSALTSSRSGRVCTFEFSQVPTSATQVRDALMQGESVAGLLPQSVQRYIVEEGLYQPPDGRQ